MKKFKRLRLPVFKMEAAGLSSYKITYSLDSGVSVRAIALPDSVLDATLNSTVMNLSPSKEISCIVEDEHQNKLRFTYIKSGSSERGFMGYLREILNENQWLISKNMSVIESIQVDSSESILINLGLDVNPVVDDLYRF